MIKQMVNYWSSYQRKFVNIQKAVFNDEVNQLLVKHYQYLHSLLVKSEQDEDTFNDTYLKLTYKYDSSKDFVEQFIYYFNLLKGAYLRDDKVANYYLQLGEVYDKGDMYFDTDTDAPDKEDKPSMQNLKESIKSYALSQKSYKRASKKD